MQTLPSKFNFFFIIGLLLIMTSPSCKNNCGGTYYVPQECKDFGYFLKGSYWVYQNDSTLQIDSFVTYLDTMGMFSFPDQNEGCTDGPAYYNNQQFTNSIAVSNISGDTLEYSCGTGGVDYYENQNFEGVYLIPDARQSNNPYKWEIFESYNLNGKFFFNVYESKLFLNATNASIYFVQNVGVIKTEISIDTSTYVESWSLLRYHIVQ